MYSKNHKLARKLKNRGYNVKSKKAGFYLDKNEINRIEKILSEIKINSHTLRNSSNITAYCFETYSNEQIIYAQDVEE